MKAINFYLLRIIFALIVGVVLVVWPDAASDYLVITIGILFMIPGLIGTIGYFAVGKDAPRRRRRFPIEAVGSFLLGLWLVIMPAFFAHVLMYVLGFILMLGGIQQIYSLVAARRWTTVAVGFYIVPSLILLAGLFIMFNPKEAIRTAFLIIGVAAIVYALTDLFNWFRFASKRPKPAAKAEIEDATIVEE